jgi:hydrogenase-4 component B
MWRHGALGERMAAVLMALGCVCGLGGVYTALSGGPGQEFVLPSPVAGAAFTVAVDALSALFLVPLLVVALLGSVYGLQYWKQAEHPENGRKLRLCYGLATGSMALLVVARSGVLFLFAWEAMALSAFFLVATEDTDGETLSAGWLYLAASHFATLCLFGLFALLHYATGTSDLAPLKEVAPGLALAIFLLALVGFGTKAGMMPLHVWLPGAHAMAPSHVSALMSGVLIKMGVYGLVRVCSLLPQPPAWWGSLILGLGVTSGVLGVAFAVGQHDVKRLLAYHSIENIGIIFMGLGLAMLGRSLGRADWAVLGLGGALLHVWNHGLFKALLFLSAGSVIHATHTREIDHLGGLAKAMPRTALAFLVGAVAICGLPPLNGFVSELFVYLGLFRTLGIGGGPSWAGAAFAAPALALIGALAAACFVKAFGAVFLGEPRSAHARQAHESGPAMLAPLAVLAACCFFIGLAPGLVAPALDQGVKAWGGPGPEPPALTDLAPLGWVSGMGLALVAALAAGALVLRGCVRRGLVGSAVTWDCGYAAPAPTMQYTSSSFAQMLVGLFGWALRPRGHRPRIEGLFPQRADFHSEVPDAALEGAVLPASRLVARFSWWLRFLQRGSIQTYLLYIFAILIILLLWR